MNVILIVLLVINHKEMLLLNNHLFNRRDDIKTFDITVNNANCFTYVTNNFKRIQNNSK